MIANRSLEELIQEAEQEILNPQHAFDMVIPGEIRIVSTLSWNEKMLYGLIRNLCRQKGYCWATNDYLADEMGISKSTVKRWIDNLLEHKALTSECFNFKMKNRRRLWITDMYEKFKKSLIGSSLSPQSVHPRTSDGVASEPEHKRYNTKENKAVCYPPPVGVDSVPEKIKKRGHREEVECSLEEVFKYAVLQKKSWTSQEINEAWKILFEYKGIVGDPLKLIDGTISNLRKEKKIEFLAQGTRNKAIQKTTHDKKNIPTETIMKKGVRFDMRLLDPNFKEPEKEVMTC